ncbi:hypothetical protein HERIO_2292 [Hepatospora eriocheir]|uniref:Methionyl/Leucyl tRNA synthetase domain-containing protein n=1 Tax=Hepatospora eriocheir TaxID=1081669 RepID=A0A1X0Q7H5_9MICR|nr:hypothetical protein HERIO_2292 [Hepatospora eriocheir]
MNVYLAFFYFKHIHCKEHRNLTQEIFLKIIDCFKLDEVFQFYCETCEQFLNGCYVEGLCICVSISNVMIVRVLCNNWIK